MGVPPGPVAVPLRVNVTLPGQLRQRSMEELRMIGFIVRKPFAPCPTQR